MTVFTFYFKSSILLNVHFIERVKNQSDLDFY